MDFVSSQPNSLFNYLCTLLILLSSLWVISAASCSPDQHSALLQLKQGFSHSELSSWLPGTDCCHGWEGVSCDVSTGHVIALDLRNQNITGNLSSVIFNITSLQYLNLAYNDFSQSGISTHGIDTLTMLTHLNLSYSNFGLIPIGIANLTKLTSLDLSDYLKGSSNISLRTLIGNLNHVRELHLDNIWFSENGTEWCGALSDSVPLLQTLSMSNCDLSGPIEPSFSRLNSLAVIHLDRNNISSPIPAYFADFPLKDLQLYLSNITGYFPHKIFQIPTLTNLDISDNENLLGTIPGFPLESSFERINLRSTNLFGSIPDSIGNLKNLSELVLAQCNFTGKIPLQFVKLVKLETLDMSSNLLSGSMPPSLFDLPNLKVLDLQNNSLSGELKLEEPSSIWSAPLTELHLSDNQLTGSSPRQYTDVDLSNNQLHGVIPSWIWESFSFDYAINLNLSHNNFTDIENIPLSVIYIRTFETLDLSFNKIKGALPLIYGNILDYSNNEFSTIPKNYKMYLGDTTVLRLATNRLTGELPSTFCVTALTFLDLSNNKLSGLIPSCILAPNMEFLNFLNLASNRFHEIVPYNISKFCSLMVLDLSNNNLDGNMPRSLTRCKDLLLVNFANNHIIDTFPFWLWKLPNLQILILRSNQLYGALEPPSMFTSNNSLFQNMRIIDISSNNLNGSLPPSLFKNLMSMANLSSNELTTKAFITNIEQTFYGVGNYVISIINKGIPMSLEESVASLMVGIDLSNNRFAGDIPVVLGELSALNFLNLSHNALIGNIPGAFKGLSQIESLDLSWNDLSGEIPQELTSLHFLSKLNLSYNNLVHHYQSNAVTQAQKTIQCPRKMPKKRSESLFCVFSLDWDLVLDLPL